MEHETSHVKYDETRVRIRCPSLYSARYICDNCYKRRNTKRPPNRHIAKNLPTTRLGTYIETRVNNFLRKKEADAGEVYIRVVYSGDKTVEVKGGMKKRSVFANLKQLCLCVQHSAPFDGKQNPRLSVD